jgi:hypothetical protein
MKFSVGIIILVASSSAVSGFQQFGAQQGGKRRIKNHGPSCFQMTNGGSGGESSIVGNRSRRVLIHNVGAAVWGLTTAAAQTVLFPGMATAGGLLDEFGTDPVKIRDSSAEREKAARELAKAAPKRESELEPNLRSNYYYPTNKKRYLPRIKKCNDAIPNAAAMIGIEDWEAVQEFAVKIAEDTILPMKLYTSSLLGGGTNVKVAFAKDMTNAANDFEKAQKKLAKYIAKKDRPKSSEALEELSTALQKYRVAGKLLGPDGGGDIPSVDEIRRSACRVQGRSFEQKIKDRDDRVKGA